MTGTASFDGTFASNTSPSPTQSPSAESSGGGFFSRLRYKGTKPMPKATESPRSSIDISPSTSEHGSPGPTSSRFSWFSRKRLTGTDITSPRMSISSVTTAEGDGNDPTQADRTSTSVSAYEDEPEHSSATNQRAGTAEVFGNLEEAFGATSVGISDGSRSRGIWDDFDPLNVSSSTAFSNPPSIRSSSPLAFSSQPALSAVPISSRTPPPLSSNTRRMSSVDFGQPGIPPPGTDMSSSARRLSPDSRPLSMLRQHHPGSMSLGGGQSRPFSLPPPPRRPDEGQKQPNPRRFVIPPPPSWSQQPAAVPPASTGRRPESHVKGERPLSASDLAFFEGA
jgi:hypothetical protein